MVAWLKEFIGRHKEIEDTLTGSVRNRNSQEPLANNKNKKNEPGSIENPLVSRRKGRPETKRYKSATEKKGKSRTYTCGACGQTGHNSVTCQNH